jgi:hypothetical protein
MECLLVAWLLCSHATDSAYAQSGGAGGQVVLSSQGGVLTATIGDQSIPLNNLQPGGTASTLGGVSFSATKDGGVQISGQSAVLISSPDIKGWKAQAPQNVPISLNLNFQTQSVAVSVPPGAGGSGTLTCDDGGQAELKSGAKGQLDFFKGGSYLFTGSGNLSVVNSDGEPQNFLIPGSSMTGGPAQLQKNSDGKEYWSKPSPSALLSLSGVPGVNLTIVAEGGGTNSAKKDGPTVVTTSQGASITFTPQPDGSLAWQVGKGQFHIAVDGIPGTTVTATSGQSASMTWDTSRKLLDVKNLSSEPIQTSMPGRSFAVVNSSVEFQYSMVTPGIFSLASAGGDVQVYNGDGNSVANVESGGLLLNAKQLLAGLTSGRGIRMRLNWDNGQPLQAYSSLATAELKPGTERVITFGKDGKAKITYSSGGFMILEAIRSNFQLVIDAVHGMTIDVVEGDKVSLTLDLKKGTFTVKTGADNINDVSVKTENGYTPVLQAARALNFNISEQGGLIASSGGQLLFYSPTPNTPNSGGLSPPPPGQDNGGGSPTPSPSTPISQGLIPPPPNSPPPQPIVSVIR